MTPIEKLGVAIANAHVVWTDEMRDAWDDAANADEKLRLLLGRYRTETPLGHQPHMIAHLVDEVLLSVPNVEVSSGAANPENSA